MRRQLYSIILLHLLLTPLIGVLVVLLLSYIIKDKEKLKWITLLFHLLGIVLSLVLWSSFFDARLYQVYFVTELSPVLDSNFYLVVDKFASKLILAITLLIPFSLICTWERLIADCEWYLSYLLLLQMFLTGLICASDMYWFSVCCTGIIITFSLVIYSWFFRY